MIAGFVGFLPKITSVRILFCLMLFFSSFGIFAAPLESGFAMAPRASASQEEKSRIYTEARLRVIDTAEKYLGTPYAYGGLTARGLDCSGLLYLSFHEALGVRLPRSVSGLYSWVERIPFENAQPGDFLFFRTDNTGNVTHVGLYLGDRRFIHSASSGQQTGVIYSNLNESYYANSFAGAGRVFPAVAPGFSLSDRTSVASDGGSGTGERTIVGNQTTPAPPFILPRSDYGNLFVGAAFAPSWNGFLPDADVLRGFASQLILVYENDNSNLPISLGFEIRPEYDGALGVFRLPITVSWGLNDFIRIFAGPVISFGEASLNIDGEERYYSGGTSWLGTIGVTATSGFINTPVGKFAPYLEIAYQSYFSDNSNFNLMADFSSIFRFSTGVRWVMQIL